MENKLHNPSNPKCTAYCPECKSDLAQIDGTCVCKNKDCGWSCTDCKEEDDV